MAQKNEQKFDEPYKCCFCEFSCIASDLLKYHIAREHLQQECTEYYIKQNGDKANEMFIMLKKETRKLKDDIKKLKEIIIDKEMEIYHYKQKINDKK